MRVSLVTSKKTFFPQEYCDTCLTPYERDEDEGKFIAVLLCTGKTRPIGLCFVCPKCAEIYKDVSFVPFADLHPITEIDDKGVKCVFVRGEWQPLENHCVECGHTDDDCDCDKTIIYVQEDGESWSLSDDNSYDEDWKGYALLVTEDELEYLKSGGKVSEVGEILH